MTSYTNPRTPNGRKYPVHVSLRSFNASLGTTRIDLDCSWSFEAFEDQIRRKVIESGAFESTDFVLSYNQPDSTATGKTVLDLRDSQQFSSFKASVKNFAPEWILVVFVDVPEDSLFHRPVSLIPMRTVEQQIPPFQHSPALCHTSAVLPPLSTPGRTKVFASPSVRSGTVKVPWNDLDLSEYYGGDSGGGGGGVDGDGGGDGGGDPGDVGGGDGGGVDGGGVDGGGGDPGDVGGVDGGGVDGGGVDGSHASPFTEQEIHEDKEESKKSSSHPVALIIEAVYQIPSFVTVFLLLHSSLPPRELYHGWKVPHITHAELSYPDNENIDELSDNEIDQQIVGRFDAALSEFISGSSSNKARGFLLDSLDKLFTDEERANVASYLCRLLEASRTVKFMSVPVGDSHPASLLTLHHAQLWQVLEVEVKEEVRSKSLLELMAERAPDERAPRTPPIVFVTIQSENMNLTISDTQKRIPLGSAQYNCVADIFPTSENKSFVFVLVRCPHISAIRRIFELFSAVSSVAEVLRSLSKIAVEWIQARESDSKGLLHSAAAEVRVLDSVGQLLERSQSEFEIPDEDFYPLLSDLCKLSSINYFVDETSNYLAKVLYSAVAVADEALKKKKISENPCDLFAFGKRLVFELFLPNDLGDRKYVLLSDLVKANLKRTPLARLPDVLFVVVDCSLFDLNTDSTEEILTAEEMKRGRDEKEHNRVPRYRAERRKRIPIRHQSKEKKEIQIGDIFYTCVGEIWKQQSSADCISRFSFINNNDNSKSGALDQSNSNKLIFALCKHSESSNKQKSSATNRLEVPSDPGLVDHDDNSTRKIETSARSHSKIAGESDFEQESSSVQPSDEIQVPFQETPEKPNSSQSLTITGLQQSLEQQPWLASLSTDFIYFEEDQKVQRPIRELLFEWAQQKISQHHKSLGVASDKSVLEIHHRLCTSATKEAEKYQTCLRDAVSHPRNFTVNWKWYLDMIMNFLLLVLLTFVGSDVIGQDFLLNAIKDSHDGCFYESLSAAPVQGIGPEKVRVDNENLGFAEKRGTTCLRNNETFSEYLERFAEFVDTQRDSCGNNGVLSVKLERLESKLSYSSGDRQIPMPNFDVPNFNYTNTFDNIYPEKLQDLSGSSNNQRIILLAKYDFEKFWYRDQDLKVSYSVFIETEWQFVDVDCRKNLRILAVPGSHDALNHGVWWPFALFVSCIILLLFVIPTPWKLFASEMRSSPSDIKMRIADLYFGSVSLSVRNRYFKRWIGWLFVMLIIVSFATTIPFFSPTRSSLVVVSLLSLVVLAINCLMHVAPFYYKIKFDYLEHLFGSTPPSSYSAATLDGDSGSSYNVSICCAAPIDKSSENNNKKLMFLENKVVKERQDPDSWCWSSFLNFWHAPDVISVERTEYTELLARLICLFFFSIAGCVLYESSCLSNSSPLADRFHAFNSWATYRPFFLFFQILWAPIGLQLIIYLPQIVGSSYQFPSTSYVTACYIVLFMIYPGNSATFPQSLNGLVDIISNFFEQLLRFFGSLETTQLRIANVFLLLLFVLLLWRMLQNLEEKREGRSFVIITASSWNSVLERTENAKNLDDQDLIATEKEDPDSSLFRWCRPKESSPSTSTARSDSNKYAQSGRVEASLSFIPQHSCMFDQKGWQIRSEQVVMMWTPRVRIARPVPLHRFFGFAKELQVKLSFLGKYGEPGFVVPTNFGSCETDLNMYGHHVFFNPSDPPMKLLTDELKNFQLPPPRWRYSKSNRYMKLLEVAFSTLAAVDDFRMELLIEEELLVRKINPSSIDFITFVSYLFHEMIDYKRKFAFFPQELACPHMVNAFALTNHSRLIDAIQRIFILLMNTAAERKRRGNFWPSLISVLSQKDPQDSPQIIYALSPDDFFFRHASLSHRLKTVLCATSSFPSRPKFCFLPHIFIVRCVFEVDDTSVTFDWNEVAKLNLLIANERSTLNANIEYSLRSMVSSKTIKKRTLARNLGEATVFENIMSSYYSNYTRHVIRLRERQRGGQNSSPKEFNLSTDVDAAIQKQVDNFLELDDMSNRIRAHVLLLLKRGYQANNKNRFEQQKSLALELEEEENDIIHKDIISGEDLLPSFLIIWFEGRRLQFGLCARGPSQWLEQTCIKRRVYRHALFKMERRTLERSIGRSVEDLLEKSDGEKKSDSEISNLKAQVPFYINAHLQARLYEKVDNDNRKNNHCKDWIETVKEHIPAEEMHYVEQQLLLRQPMWRIVEDDVILKNEVILLYQRESNFSARLRGSADVSVGGNYYQNPREKKYSV